MVDAMWIVWAVLGGVAFRTTIPFIKIFLEKRGSTSSAVQQPVFDYYFLLTAMFSFSIALALVMFVFLQLPLVPPMTSDAHDAFLVISSACAGFVVNEIINRSIGH